VLELGFSGLVVCEDHGFTRLMVDIVDIVKQGSFRVQFDFSISTNPVLPCAGSSIIFPRTSFVPLESSYISTLRLSIIALTPVSSSSRMR